jgi:hypothetical protein
MPKKQALVEIECSWQMNSATEWKSVHSGRFASQSGLGAAARRGWWVEAASPP